MAETIYSGNNIDITTFAGPAYHSHPTRKHYQISVISDCGGFRDVMALSQKQFENLTDALICLDNGGKSRG